MNLNNFSMGNAPALLTLHHAAINELKEKGRINKQSDFIVIVAIFIYQGLKKDSKPPLSTSILRKLLPGWNYITIYKILRKLVVWGYVYKVRGKFILSELGYIIISDFVEALDKYYTLFHIEIGALDYIFDQNGKREYYKSCGL